jgi:putative spermidine/putrescine transport system ATP-binding protein
VSAVDLKDIVKRFGDFTAVHRMSLGIPEAAFVTLLGPSGCGKTTTLRMIAGLLDPTEGDISIKGRRVNDLPIHKRNLGLVFQNYALFPHRTVFQNVAFGLKYRDVPKPTSSAGCATRWSWCACPISPTAIRSSFRAASSSASRWPAPW